MRNNTRSANVLTPSSLRRSERSLAHEPSKEGIVGVELDRGRLLSSTRNSAPAIEKHIEATERADQEAQHADPAQHSRWRMRSATMRLPASVRWQTSVKISSRAKEGLSIHSLAS